jgi:lipopolysaccharide heptosyltransferase II
LKKNSDSLKILLVRNDRIGDLVLTTPAIEVLRAHLPQARIDLLCSAYAAPVVAGNPHLNEVLTDRGAQDSSDLKQTARLLRSRKYDCAVVLVHSSKNARLVRKARIPKRIGPLVKWYSFLFFNRTVRQQRSLAVKNEATYNIELLKPLGVSTEKTPNPFVKPTEQALERAREYLATEFRGCGPGPLVLIHPGMGGSALNWPAKHYAELVRMLLHDNKYRVLLTGDDRDKKLIDRVKEGIGADKPLRLGKKMPLEDFIGLVAQAGVVVAPSTGPLHLAGALGVPLAGIYSPLQVQHPRRWGPLGPGGKKIFMPREECTSTFNCKEERCLNYPCMSTVGPEEVLEFIKTAIS